MLKSTKEDLEAWSKADSLKTITSYRDYLGKFEPAIMSIYALKEIKGLEQELDFWRKSLSLNTQDSYNEYLEKYPNGHNVKRAKEKIESAEVERKILITVVLVLIFLTLIWIFDTPDTEFKISPGNAHIRINGDYIRDINRNRISSSLFLNADYELEEKYNDIEVSAPGYKTVTKRVKKGEKKVYITLENVYEKALKANAVDYQAYIYEKANHGFHNDSTGRYVENQAELAWSRTLAFFNKHLQT